MQSYSARTLLPVPPDRNMRPLAEVMLSPLQAQVRLTKIKPGERIIYHVGHLAKDAAISRTVKALRGLAGEFEMMGKVALTQRRLGVDDYHYIAIGLDF